MRPGSPIANCISIGTDTRMNGGGRLSRRERRTINATSSRLRIGWWTEAVDEDTQHLHGTVRAVRLILLSKLFQSQLLAKFFIFAWPDDRVQRKYTVFALFLWASCVGTARQTNIFPSRAIFHTKSNFVYFNRLLFYVLSLCWL